MGFNGLLMVVLQLLGSPLDKFFNLFIFAVESGNNGLLSGGKVSFLGVEQHLALRKLAVVDHHFPFGGNKLFLLPSETAGLLVIPRT